MAEEVAKKNSGAGLRGQSAGETAVCTVGAEGNSLRYRGYDVVELAEHSTFYEVAYMILKGSLPTKAELEPWKAKLKSLRGLPQPPGVVTQLSLGVVAICIHYPPPVLELVHWLDSA